MSTQCTFETGKKKRNELRLPTLRFVVADDWMDKLGMDAFRAWLKFHTWVDRTDSNREEDKIPYTIESVCKRLGISKKKFYEKVMRPLWNHGLIDTVEYTEYKQKGKKPVNIVVYESPFNKHETEILELEKVRDYDTEYQSVSQAHGRKGGRPKKKIKKVTLKGFQMETLKLKVSKSKRLMVSKWKPNNYKSLNNISNDSNKQQTERVVVAQSNIEYLFEKKLSKKTVQKLIDLSEQHNVSLDAKIQNTNEYHTKVEKCENVFGSIKYAIENGDWEINSPTPTQQKKSKKLTKAVQQQLDIKNGVASVEPEMPPDELAAAKERIARRLARVDVQ